MFFGFGRKKRSSKNVRKHKKPPARLIKMCKRYGIKCTKKVGKRRVYKSLTVIKRQLKRKMKNRKSKFGAKNKRTRRRTRRTRRKTRRTRFSLFGFKI